jgi:hypothetical protein
MVSFWYEPENYLRLHYDDVRRPRISTFGQSFPRTSKRADGQLRWAGLSKEKARPCFKKLRFPRWRHNSWPNSERIRAFYIEKLFDKGNKAPNPLVQSSKNLPAAMAYPSRKGACLAGRLGCKALQVG